MLPEQLATMPDIWGVRQRNRGVNVRNHLKQRVMAWAAFTPRRQMCFGETLDRLDEDAVPMKHWILQSLCEQLWVELLFPGAAMLSFLIVAPPQLRIFAYQSPPNTCGGPNKAPAHT